MPYLEGSNWYTKYLDDFLSSGVIPPSPVVVEVPIADAPRPRASFALAPRAPKLIPAIVIGISRVIGFFANRSPMTTEVLHFSRYPSKGYLEADAPKNTRSSKLGTFLLAPKPRI